MHSLLKYEKSDIEYSHKFNTWASITESNGHPPPRKILDRGSPPPGRGLFGKLFPLLEKFEPKIQRVPPWPENPSPQLPLFSDFEQANLFSWGGVNQSQENI